MVHLCHEFTIQFVTVCKPFSDAYNMGPEQLQGLISCFVRTSIAYRVMVSRPTFADVFFSGMAEDLGELEAGWGLSKDAFKHQKPHVSVELD